MRWFVFTTDQNWHSLRRFLPLIKTDTLWGHLFVPLIKTDTLWGDLFVSWLHNILATCDMHLRERSLTMYMLPHWDRNCRSNFHPPPVKVNWHLAKESLLWQWSTRCLTWYAVSTTAQRLSHWYDYATNSKEQYLICHTQDRCLTIRTSCETFIIKLGFYGRLFAFEWGHHSSLLALLSGHHSSPLALPLGHHGSPFALQWWHDSLSTLPLWQHGSLSGLSV